MGPPGWVFTYDAIFQIVFALITLAIGIFSLKIWNYTKQRQPKIFGLSFISISISFWILSLLNLGMVHKAMLLLRNIPLDSGGLTRLMLAGHMSFYIIGVITLFYLTLKIKSEHTYHIIILITFLAILAASQKLFFFYAIASVLFGYVFFNYYKLYNKKKQLKNLLVMLGFGFLFLANVNLIFSVGNAFYYMLGNVLELIGYCFLLVNLAMVFKK